MLGHQELSDRFEIQDLLAQYCDAIDSRDWGRLDNIFTSDAIIDYTEAGGARGGLEATKTYLDRALKPFSGMQHMLGLPIITISEDSARARTPLFNPMIIMQENEPHTFFVGMWYEDELVRTSDGWRIKSRREKVSYFHNVPPDFTPVDP